MNKKLKTFIVVCTILIVVGGCLASVGIMLGATGNINLKYIPWKLNENGGCFQFGEETPENQATFSGENLKDSLETNETVHMIKTKVGVGNIKFTESDAFKVEYRYDKGFGKPDVKISDGTITIIDKLGKVGNSLDIKKWSDSEKSNEIEYEIFYPKGTAFELIEMDNNIGEIYISNIQTEKLKLKLDAGEIKLVDVIADDVNIDLNIGNIITEGIKTNALSASMDMGDISVNGTLKGENIISNNMGDIKITTTLAKEEYSLKLNTQLGDIKVNGDRKGGVYEVSNNTDHTINAENSLGDIIVKFN